MRILLIRHGIAEDREGFAESGREDALRPLTRGGRKKMRRASRGMALLVPDVSVLGTSPLLRAVQTGKIIVRQYESLEPVQVPQLLPRKSLPSLLTWVSSQKSDATIALVGHEPHLSTFAGWLLTGLQESFVDLRKGAAVLLELGDEVKPGHARLLWALRSSHLRKIGK
jgi:phosphohistidine phosphatase